MGRRSELIKEIIILQARRDWYLERNRITKAEQCEERIESLQADVIEMSFTREGGKENGFNE